MTSWFWDSAEAVVLAPGVIVFRRWNGICPRRADFAGGVDSILDGICQASRVCTKSVALKEMKWSGLRLNVVFEGAQGLTIDVRSKVADAATSIAASPVTCAADGTEEQSSSRE